MKDFRIRFWKFHIIVLWLICPTRRIVAHQGRKTFEIRLLFATMRGRREQGMKNSCHSQAKLYHWHQRCRTSLSRKHFFIVVIVAVFGITDLWYNCSSLQCHLSILRQQHKPLMQLAKTTKKEIRILQLWSCCTQGWPFRSLGDLDRLRRK